MGSTAVAGPTAKKTVVEIAFKREHESFRYRAQERVDRLREEALDHFEIEDRRDRFALFNADGDELDNDVKLRDAGVHPGDRLRLRSKVVAIIYNGREEAFTYKAEEPVGELLQRALRKFGVTSNAHLMSLFDADNRELPEGPQEPLKAV